MANATMDAQQLNEVTARTQPQGLSAHVQGLSTDVNPVTVLERLAGFRNLRHARALFGGRHSASATQPDADQF
jgi:hypothetical protein